MKIKITERILIIDHLLRENKTKKLGKQELLDALNHQLMIEKLNTISIRQFDNDITNFKKKLGKKLSIKEGAKTIYYYNRKDISINNSLGVQSKDIKLAIDFIKGFRGENVLLKTLETEIEKKFNVKSASLSPFHLDSNNIYEKEYSKFIPKIYKAIINAIVLKITYVPRKKDNEKIIYTVHPYLLKEFNGRWFVFGYCLERSEITYFHLSIDNRILKIEENHSIEFKTKSKKIDYDLYFNNRVGVSDGIYGMDKTKYKIKLRFTKDYYDYIQTKPLSNIIGQPRSIGDFIELTFNMCINNELISKLFSYKSNCEVLEPEVLREKMREEIKKINEIYI
jgi:predicted DNA-binding transcriptional regulator YafY